MVGRSLGEDESMALDAELIKVLAADSRRDILRLLGERRMTLTELATALDLKKATILEHLKKLTDVDLIRRREDERLWVYYELTPRGVRVVHPGRTRFYLLFAAAVVALAFGAVALSTLVADDVPPEAPLAGDAPPAAFVADATVGQGEPIRVLASGGGQAYLLDEAAAAAVRQGRSGALGLPLHPGAWSVTNATTYGRVETDAAAPSGDASLAIGGLGRADAATPLATTAAVEPGTYYVYVVDEQGRSNAASLPQVVVEPYALHIAEPVAWRGLTSSVPLLLERGGERVENATLLLQRDGRTVAEIPVRTRGEAALFGETLDALAPGRYHFALAAATPVDLGRGIDIRDPQLALLTPEVVAAPMVELRLRSSVADLPERLPHGPFLHLPDLADGHLLQEVEPGVVAADIDGLAPGEHTLALGRLWSATLVVHEAVSAHVAPAEDEGRFTLTVANASGAPVAGAALFVNETLVEATDANGTVPLPVLANGTHDARLVPARGPAHRLALVADGGGVRLGTPTLRANVTGNATEGAVHLLATLSNPSPVETRAVVTAYLDSVPRDARAVTVAANATLDVAFQFSSERPGAVLADVSVAPLRLVATSHDDGGLPAPSEAPQADAAREPLRLLVPAPFVPTPPVAATPVPADAPGALVPVPVGRGAPTAATPAAVPGASPALLALALVAALALASAFAPAAGERRHRDR